MGTITHAVHDRQRDHRKRALLQRHPLLAGCPTRVIKRVAACADDVTFASGDLLAEQGRSPAWFFLIEEGTAEVARDGVPLGVVGPGGHYGEVPLLCRGMHPATVRAITPMSVWVIGCQRFGPLVDDVSSIGDALRESLEEQADLVALVKAERERRIHPRPAIAWPRSRRPRRAGARALALAAALLAAALGAAAAFHPPYAVIAPGPVIDVSHDIVITGVPVHQPHARYLLVTVRSERPSLLGLVGASFRGMKVERVRTTTAAASAQRRQQLEGQFAKSQRDAVAAAAAALGIPGATSGRLPFTVSFRHRDVVGPSAGLVYALAIDDLLSGVDNVHGVVAATGQVDAAGDVGSVGYVREKAIGASRAGAGMLVAPTSDTYEAGGIGILVVGVSSVQEALARLGARS